MDDDQTTSVFFYTGEGAGSPPGVSLTRGLVAGGPGLQRVGLLCLCERLGVLGAEVEVEEDHSFGPAERRDESARRRLPRLI